MGGEQPDSATQPTLVVGEDGNLSLCFAQPNSGQHHDQVERAGPRLGSFFPLPPLAGKIFGLPLVGFCDIWPSYARRAKESSVGPDLAWSQVPDNAGGGGASFPSHQDSGAREPPQLCSGGGVSYCVSGVTITRNIPLKSFSRTSSGSSKSATVPAWWQSE